MIAVLDACVLYPPALRDVLMWLAVVKAYEPRWTEEIHSEWMRNVLSDRPEITSARLERTRLLMNQIDPSSVVSGYETRIPALCLPDENDRHVLAAAIQGGASVIVTYNLSDFPRQALASHGVEAQHPDAFLRSLLHWDPSRFLRGIRNHRASLHNPAKTVEEYLAALRDLRLSTTARHLDAHRDAI